jgi:hypothetical protein
MVKVVTGPDGQPQRIKTGGRGKGAKNLLTRAMEQAKKEAIERLNKNMPGGYKAIDLMQAIYAAEDLDLQVRMKAAEVALRYETPALQSVETNMRGEVGFYVAQPIAVAERDPIPGYTAPAPTVAKQAEVLPKLAKPSAPKPSAIPGFIERDPLPGAGITDVVELAEP